jgi:hypothetical protein
MAISQRRLRIRSLPEGAAKAGISPALEISTKADDHLGRSLSALNLTSMIRTANYIPLRSFSKP